MSTAMQIKKISGLGLLLFLLVYSSPVLARVAFVTESEYSADNFNSKSLVLEFGKISDSVIGFDSFLKAFVFVNNQVFEGFSSAPLQSQMFPLNEDKKDGFSLEFGDSLQEKLKQDLTNLIEPTEKTNH